MTCILENCDTRSGVDQFTMNLSDIFCMDQAKYALPILDRQYEAKYTVSNILGKLYFVQAKGQSSSKTHGLDNSYELFTKGRVQKKKGKLSTFYQKD